MKRRGMITTAALVALVLAIASQGTSASPITVVEGTPVFFGGLSFFYLHEPPMQEAEAGLDRSCVRLGVEGGYIPRGRGD